MLRHKLRIDWVHMHVNAIKNKTNHRHKQYKSFKEIPISFWLNDICFIAIIFFEAVYSTLFSNCSAFSVRFNIHLTLYIVKCVFHLNRSFNRQYSKTFEPCQWKSCINYVSIETTISGTTRLREDCKLGEKDEKDASAEKICVRDRSSVVPLSKSCT